MNTVRYNFFWLRIGPRSFFDHLVLVPVELVLKLLSFLQLPLPVYVLPQLFEVLLLLSFIQVGSSPSLGRFDVARDVVFPSERGFSNGSPDYFGSAWCCQEVSHA